MVQPVSWPFTMSLLLLPVWTSRKPTSSISSPAAARQRMQKLHAGVIEIMIYEKLEIQCSKKLGVEPQGLREFSLPSLSKRRPPRKVAQKSQIPPALVCTKLGIKWVHGKKVIFVWEVVIPNLFFFEAGGITQLMLTLKST